MMRFLITRLISDELVLLPYLAAFMARNPHHSDAAKTFEPSKSENVGARKLAAACRARVGSVLGNTDRPFQPKDI